MPLPDQFLLAFASHFSVEVMEDFDDTEALDLAAKSCVANLATSDQIKLSTLRDELSQFLEEQDRETALKLSDYSNTDWMEDMDTLRSIIESIINWTESYQDRQ